MKTPTLRAVSILLALPQVGYARNFAGDTNDRSLSTAEALSLSPDAIAARVLAEPHDDILWVSRPLGPIQNVSLHRLVMLSKPKNSSISGLCELNSYTAKFKDYVDPNVLARNQTMPVDGVIIEHRFKIIGQPALASRGKSFDSCENAPIPQSFFRTNNEDLLPYSLAAISTVIAKRDIPESVCLFAPSPINTCDEYSKVKLALDNISNILVDKCGPDPSPCLKVRFSPDGIDNGAGVNLVISRLLASNNASGIAFSYGKLTRSVISVDNKLIE